MIVVFINGGPHTLNLQSNLIDLLKEISLAEARGIAVAVNNEVIVKSDWQDHILKQNDSITVIRATQGG